MSTHDPLLTPRDPAHDSAAASAGAAQPGAPGQSGEDVMRILADVESHLTRLRSAQKQQDQTLASITDRSHTLEQAEQALEHQRQSLRAQLEQVQNDQQRLAHERAAFEEHCRQIDREMQKRCEELESQRRAFEQQRTEMAREHDQARAGMADLEQARGVWDQHRQKLEEQLQRAQAEADQRATQLARRQEETAAAQAQLEKQRHETQAKLDAHCAELEKRAAELARLEKATKAAETDRKDLLVRVEQAERNVGELIEQVERSQHQLAEHARLAKEAAERNHALQRQVEALARQAQESQRDLEAQRKELGDTQVARDAAMAELEAVRKKLASQQRDMRARDDEIAALQQRLSEAQSKLAATTHKLAEVAQALSEQAPQLERGAAALAMVQEQAEQMDRLTKQLAELQLSSDPQEIQRRDKRIEELTEALREARGQNPDSAPVAQLEQRTAELEQEVRQLTLKLQNAQIAADEARQQLQAYIDNGAGQHAKDASLAQHAAKIAELTAEIERLNASAAATIDEKLTAQSKRHQKELSEVRGPETKVVKQLRQRVADLESQVARANAEAASAAASDRSGAEDSEYLNRLRAKAEQITTIAEHLRRRRDRLEKMRRLMRAKQENAPATAQGIAGVRAEQLQQIDRERQHLLEVRKMLVASEYQMMRRWARQRAAFTVACMVLIVLFCGGASWLAVNYFLPPKVAASVVLEARSRPGAEPLSREQRESWTQWHATLVQNVDFQQSLAKRMAERKLERWSRPDAVSAVIARDLAVDDDQAGVVMYTLAGTEADEMTTFLDVLAGTILVESNRESTRRSDNANSIATGERKEDGRVRYASINPVPLIDDRMDKGVPLFGIMTGVMLILSGALYLKFARARRVFDEENASLFAETRASAAA